MYTYMSYLHIYTYVCIHRQLCLYRVYVEVYPIELMLLQQLAAIPIVRVNLMGAYLSD